MPPCADGCAAHGTCNVLSGRCECPLTRVGRACEALALPACAIGGVALRPTLVAADWERCAGPQTARAPETPARAAPSVPPSNLVHRRARWLGPLTCACLDQLVAMRHVLYYRDPWRAALRVPATCAEMPGDDQSVGALLDAPGVANWTARYILFRGWVALQARAERDASPRSESGYASPHAGMTAQAARQPPPGGDSWFTTSRPRGTGRLRPPLHHKNTRPAPRHNNGGRRGVTSRRLAEMTRGGTREARGTAPAAAARLVALSQCPQRCSNLGSCVLPAPGHHNNKPRCECFPPSVKHSRDGCAMPRLPLR